MWPLIVVSKGGMGIQRRLLNTNRLIPLYTKLRLWIYCYHTEHSYLQQAARL